MNLTLSGQISAQVTKGTPGKYNDDSAVLGCGKVLEDPSHPSYLGTWRSTIAGITYLFYLNIGNYNGPGTYSFSTPGNYVLLRDPSSAAAPPDFYPAAQVNSAGDFINNRGDVTIGSDARHGSLTSYLSNAADFNAALSGPSTPQVDLTITGSWVCP